MVRSRVLAGILLLALALPLLPAPGIAAQTTCGRPSYPDATSYDPDAVTDSSLWDALRGSGGFSDGVEGLGSVSVTVADGARTHIVTLEEIVVHAYVGGGFANRTNLALRVRTEVDGQVVATHAFTLVSAADRPGGNLTLVARAQGGALDIFWRWAYLACSADFPNVYYVFHARIDGDAIADDNTLVYFEAPRPRRPPPVDLILLIIAGIAVSIIFLFARRALRKR
ncbi:MAG: hypothetical protein HY557_03920 [Euryarchaeota archaeon]|nr:hypothetical protein [Euryarchaeota archaeon]